ncbi:MAG TPA: tripartite tricarboxylate transporter substrate binding protein [Burkholderiales bacterium]|jgi:tripartite-type tricarboxylate transporter receptor subunit TctC|nr:tripartite tricarboxylate transporter substrate binding protein [Burkholderiales bacterium]
MDFAVRFIVAGMLCASAPAALAQAAGYPVKPVRWVVPFPPGGSADIMGRMIGQDLAKTLGQQVVVENRAGASAIVGSEYVAKSSPDGYTLLQANVSQMTIHPSLYPRLPYDPLKDFSPVTVLGIVTSVMVTTPALPVTSVKELIALAKKRPAQLNFTSSGAGSSTHLTGELLKQRAGIAMTHINYKGSGPALTDVMAGFVEIMFENLPSALPFISANKLKVLAVTGKDRSPVLKSVPTLAESGFPGFDMVSWQALVAPAGTPRPVIEKLNAEVARVLKTPEMKEKMAGLGADVVANSADQFAQYLREETAKWSKIVRDAGLKLEI